MAKNEYPVAGAKEGDPSRSHYFSWINNTNEGSTEAQTLINLRFFNMLNRKYGMKLDIYAWDAGNLDGSKKTYGTFESEKFLSQYPNGYKTIVDCADESGIRLGLWGGPDGFGKTKEDAEKRIELMRSLCRDYHFALFKFDGVCGTLRRNKRSYFCEMMKECRKYSPDLILLNHRLNFGSGNKYATTFLWQGRETYVDVFLFNEKPAMHNRGGIFYRGNVPDFMRMTDDHGTCISSSIDYFEDDLIYQAFGRCLILSPSIYGNPWLMKDEELPRLARIFSLHRQNREILTEAIDLNSLFGCNSVSRGSDKKRFLLLGNDGWETKKCSVPLDETVGLKKCDRVKVILHHPYEQNLGTYNYGDKIDISVMPFRASLAEISEESSASRVLDNICYEIITEKDGKPDEIKTVFDGKTDLREPAPIKFGSLKKCAVPSYEKALYEATCISLDNDSLEMRSLRRSGETKIPEVKAARDAFFNQKTYIYRGCDSNILFDGNPDTWYDTKSVYYDGGLRIDGGCFRFDAGAEYDVSKIEFEYFSIDKEIEEVKIITPPESGEFSADLKKWKKTGKAEIKEIGRCTTPVIIHSVHNIVEKEGKRIRLTYTVNGKMRYINFASFVDRIYSVKIFDKNGKEIKPVSPKATNLMAPYECRKAGKAFKLKVTVPEKDGKWFIAVACDGNHGNEGIYCAAESEGNFIGAPSRAPAYPSNVFEHLVVRAGKGYTYYIPVTDEMKGKEITLWALQNRNTEKEIKVSAYLCPEHR